MKNFKMVHIFKNSFLKTLVTFKKGNFSLQLSTGVWLCLRPFIHWGPAVSGLARALRATSLICCPLCILPAALLIFLPGSLTGPGPPASYPRGLSLGLNPPGRAACSLTPLRPQLLPGPRPQTPGFSSSFTSRLSQPF